MNRFVARRLVFAVLLFASAAVQLRASDLDVLSNRLKTSYLRSYKVDDSKADALFSSIRGNGSWEDIDYSRHEYRTPRTHLKRVKEMSLAYASEDSRYHADSSACRMIAAALEYWRQNSPVFDNWYDNQIGNPLAYMEALLLIKDQLDPSEVGSLSSFLVDRTSIASLEGKNRTWVSSITIHKGIFESDEALVRRGFESLASTIAVQKDGKDGLQPDFSIHQHHPQLYMGGYGREMLIDWADFMTLAKDTEFESVFTEEMIQTASSAFLDGEMMYTFRDYLDYTAIGRCIARPGKSKSISERVLREMMTLDPDRAAEYSFWIRHLHGYDFPVPGNRYFWRSSSMTHHGPDSFFTVKMPSVRNNGGECLSGQNTKGFYLPMGAVNIVTRGDEYDNIAPIWDWTAIPGVTCSVSQDSCILPHYNYGINEFAGGVSDGRHGLAAFECDQKGVEVQKAYFFTGSSMLCFGCGIESGIGEEIRTTLNQCISHGKAIYGQNGEEKTLEDGRVSGTLDWVYHDNVGYVFLQKCKSVLQKEQMSGSYRQIDTAGPKKEVTGDVFSLSLSHGVSPRRGSYAYAVFAGKPVSYFRSKDYQGEFEIVRNDPSVQAARCGSVVAVVFRKPGHVKAGSLRLASDKPALVLAVLDGEEWRINVADPLYKEDVMVLKVNGRSYEVSMPAGLYRGSTVAVNDAPVTAESPDDEIATRVALWQMENIFPGKRGELDWTNAVFYRGLYEWADITSDKRMFDFLLDVGERNGWGLIDLPGRYYHADDICMAQTYVKLYQKYGRSEMLEVSHKRMKSIVDNPKHIRLWMGDPGGQDRWNWCDALFMAPPAYIAMNDVRPDRDYCSFAISEYKATRDSLYSPEYHMFFRDSRYKSMKEANGQPIFWGRGNGWVYGGLCLIMELLGPEHPEFGYFEALFKEMTAAIVERQDSNGSWHASMLDYDAYPEAENSSSAFFTYGLLWGINHGIIDKDTYDAAAVRGWEALKSYVHPSGKLGNVQKVGADPKSCGYENFEKYGAGAFLLAASEWHRRVN